MNLDHLAHATAPAPEARPAPKGWEPGVTYQSGIPDTITTPLAPEAHDSDGYRAMMDDFGWPLPAGARLELVEARFDPVAWTRDTARDDDGKTPAVTRPVWRYRFKVVTDPATVTREDIDTLARMLEKNRNGKAPTAPKTDSAYVVVLADVQAGKAHDGPDGDQGTEQTVARLLGTLERIAADIRRIRPPSIVILDPGDAIENCMNTSSQPRTNDLDLTSQVRIWQRLLMRYIRRLSPLAPHMIVAGVPSNHGQVRLGPKAPASGPWDDYGLLAMTSVQDAVEMALPGANIEFAYPRRGLDTLTIPVAGTNIGVAHGHHANSADKIPEWIGKQAAGRQPLHDADVVVTGHFHHMRYQQILGGRWWLQAPAADAGSAWWTRISGEWSAPGILTFQTSSGRVHDVKVN